MTLLRIDRVRVVLAVGILLLGVLPITTSAEGPAIAPTEPQMSGDRDAQGAQGSQGAPGAHDAIDTRSQTGPQSSVEGRGENTEPAFRSPEVSQPETLQPIEPASPGSDLERAARPGRSLTPF